MATQNPTANYDWVLPTVGGSADAWGTIINALIGDDVAGIDAIVKAVSDVANAALPKAGGTLTGALVLGDHVNKNVDDSSLNISGGTATNTGGNINLVGPSHATLANRIQLRSGATVVLELQSGAAALTGTLGVSGATTLSSTLAVTGAATLSSTLTVVGAATLQSTLAVSGAVTGGTYNGQTISGAASLTGTLAVAGATTLSSTLSVTGAATLSSTLAVTGAATLSSTLAVTGAVTLSNHIQKNVGTSSLNVSGGTATNSGGNINLVGAGHPTLASRIQLRSDATIVLELQSGAATLTGTLTASGAVTASSFIKSA